jgi:adenylosuccinate synthase
MPASVVVGGQFGSEGKGKVALEIARRASEPVTAVRVGGSNSGHARTVLPAGSYIDVDLLLQEAEVLGLGPDRLVIDQRAKVITDRHRGWENNAGLTGSIGSTASGTGAAVIANVARRSPAFAVASPRAGEVPELREFIGRADAVLAERLGRRERVIVEGTQGFGLSLNFGEWPFVTSRDTTAAAFAAEAAVPVTEIDDVTLVLRCHPIRVGGQSGPLPGETDWRTIAQACGADRDISERTTVTNRLRRVASFDPAIVREAVAANGPTRIALNHLDYVDWAVRDGSLTERAIEFVSNLEWAIGRRIDWLGTDERMLVDRPSVGNVHLLAS